MNQFIISAAMGLISGIVIAQNYSLPRDWMHPVFLTGLFLLLFAFAIAIARKKFWPLSFTALLCFGIVNTTRHMDLSTPGHLAAAVQLAAHERNITLEGTVTQPPDVRELYTIVPLRVIRLELSKGIPIPVNRGLVYIKLYPEIGKLYSSIAYGDRLEFTGIRLHSPAPAVNPGTFDMRAFLYNQGYFATVSVRRPDQIRRTGSGSGSPLIRLSEHIKSRLLITIKQTLPYPESSFLGGVLLGLRSGLSNEIKDTFRAAGVSHVLAVSGLHVTIITLFFMGMFRLIRVPRTSSFIIIVCALLLFTLITGARPSTVRAAIMNGVTLLFFYFRGIKLDRSFLLGISVAAIAILLRNPLLITEASFLFSFSAVLSLALLTQPVFRLCCRHLRGFFRVLLFVEILFFTSLACLSPSVFTNRLSTVIMVLALLPAAAVVDRFVPPFFEFRRLPLWFSTFFAAQIAIQLGMLPLTALFFKKVSVAAPLANFIAIPLIGVIVQLGLFAGILGTVPIAGSYLALCLNASNWLFIKLFLATASFFGTRFPYPDVSPPDRSSLLLYYSVLLALSFYPRIHSYLAPRVRYLLHHWHAPSILARLAILVLLGLFLAVRFTASFQPSAPHMKITLLEPSIFFMGGGNAVLIKTPLDRHFLVDAGPRYSLRRNEPVDVDVGRRIVLPALLETGARHLDGIIVTNPDSSYSGGVSSVLENPWITVSEIFHGFPFANLDHEDTTDDILKRFEDPSLFMGNERRRAELTAWSLRDIFFTAETAGITLTAVREGTVIHRETVVDEEFSQEFSITVLNPPESRFSGPYSARSNSVVLRISFGRINVIILSMAGKSVQNNLVSQNRHHAQVVLLAANGAQHAFVPEFIEPAVAVIAAPLPSVWAQKEFSKTYEMIKSMGKHVFRTDRGGAVIMSSDGLDLQIEQFIEQEKRVFQP